MPIKRLIAVLLLASTLHAASLVTAYSFATTQNNITGCYGMRITTAASTTTYLQLGIYCASGNTGNHTVYVLASGSYSVVGSAVVSLTGCTPGNTYYGSTSVTLNAYSYYYIVTPVTNGGQNWYAEAPITLNATYGNSPRGAYSATACTANPVMTGDNAGQAYVGFDASTTAAPPTFTPRAGQVADVAPTKGHAAGER